MTEDEYDFQHHRKIYAQRNFDKVLFGQWLIKTWYFSPYPLTENEDHEPAQTTSSAGTPKTAGVHKPTARSHARTADLFASGLNRSNAQGERSLLWVCDMCFKYMTDNTSWELHKKSCQVEHPPGNKVYQRGAHTIWEVDGSKAKLYCQNLSLFGKLFIDVKTLFFDCDNFLFYILTDASSRKDHLIGFFSKEKVSYDDYNLACILTLPPFQKMGFGALMIEFSYELSRREGKTGTPERPLSDLGLRSYLAYWVSALIRFFRKLLTVLPPSTTEIVTKGAPPDLGSPIRESSEDGIKRRKKTNKGWDGEVAMDDTAFDSIDDKLASFRHFVTTANPDGSATTHVRIECTLADIAEATNIRVEDAAFALQEVGMLDRWGQIRKPGIAPGGGDAEEPSMKDDVVVLTREIVERVAGDRKVKKTALVPKYIVEKALQPGRY
ncbi:acyl-CoA N-acyltransferase [Dendrothele bispora CBS 962.96]|uniref:histone acetyltransferase n=1 Tax=Dendrothele bispora (strain CBS 962.96) TaxID=1314807 RepID=A0A4S8MFN6_DENBC|nr:acyl-CoA N-acyltransferase [Dendrothele bispora CBS 962.96]